MERLWHPYAADQQFGARAAADETLVDETLEQLEQRRRRTPRAGNKAPVQPAPVDARWAERLMPRGHPSQPITTAVALEAAPQMRPTAG